MFESARQNFRMRAEFRVWHEGDESFLAMFDSDDPKTPVEVPQFPMGSERINQLMPAILDEIKANEVLRKKLFQVNFLTTVKGDALVSMLYHRRLTEEWEEAANAARARLDVSIIGRSRKQKVRPVPRLARLDPPKRVRARRVRPPRPRSTSPEARPFPLTIKHESYHRIIFLSHDRDDHFMHHPLRKRRDPGEALGREIAFFDARDARCIRPTASDRPVVPLVLALARSFAGGARERLRDGGARGGR